MCTYVYTCLQGREVFENEGPIIYYCVYTLLCSPWTIRSVLSVHVCYYTTNGHALSSVCVLPTSLENRNLSFDTVLCHKTRHLTLCRKFYYALDNYYQNHRRYLNSWDPAQLRGDNFRSPDSNCRPLVR